MFLLVLCSEVSKLRSGTWMRTKGSFEEEKVDDELYKMAYEKT